MLSNVQICNLALNHIGLKSIVSLEQENAQARQLKAIFDMARDSVLRAHTWNFAARIEPLSLINGEVIPGWDFLYAYPSSCLFVRKIFNEGNANDTLPPDKWREVRSPTTNVRSIACDVEQAYIEYTVRVLDPSLYDHSFVEAFSYLLANMTAQVLTGDKSLAKDMFAIYSNKIDIARLTNMSESNNPKTEFSAFYNVR